MREPRESSDQPVDGVFVYGTLKRGQCRAAMWPHPPLSIEPAWVRGKLFGRSDYPAMRSGEDQVRGEVWRFHELVIPEVLVQLDEIEGTLQPSGEPDLYHRVVVNFFRDDGSLGGSAYAYVYAADPRQDGFHPIDPIRPGGEVSWP
jgi:gamma-glutamylcyclotransferase (GGCT)/AIG2-like uncharacterized protein YtfP